ncbi:hypothetical protein [Bosea sp. (in: a-proteobacteria)]|uniref:hypothetical protein n=1 Tax=Bosea sp. (in: a-proteobacteria) TaxID=1871050 RepID=UPI002733A523|nr:hypothetical protein [Bosea sp. (in: a-proteobacteria)]MDP3407202.1 hypothetical protein [Bosea sp. (in: a-proteobacteria)]
MRIMLVLVLMVAAVAARAAPLDDAISAWLADDDAVALPALSALAQAGDDDAMLALGVIEPRAWEGPYVQGLDRAQRIAVLRRPGGLSGESWLASVTVRRPLAEAVLQARQKGDPWPLMALGQTDAARGALAMAFNQNPSSLAESAWQRDVPDALRGLVWRGAALRLARTVYPTPPSPDVERSLRAVVAQAFAPEWSGSLQQMLFFSGEPDLGVGIPVPQAASLVGRVLRQGRLLAEGDTRFRSASEPARDRALAAARTLLTTAPEAAAVRQFCTPSCEQTLDSCVETLWSLTGGADAQAHLHTPLDALIPQNRYVGSPRHRGDMIRMAQKRFRTAPPGIDACAAKLVFGG